MTSSVYISATGARTALGFAAQSAAAVRASISALGEHPFMIDQAGEPMASAIDKKIQSTISCRDRIFCLAVAAIRDLCTGVERMRTTPGKVPLYLALPEIRPGFSEQDVETIVSGLLRLEDLPIGITKVEAIAEGHAAGLSAIAMGVRDLQLGAIEACLVGGVESYFSPDTMEWLDENRQLAGSVSRSGFVPGEGAAFCLLTTEHSSARLGLSNLAQIGGVALSIEGKLIKTSDICLGEGLTSAVREIVRDLHPPLELISDIVCDINGERYRGEEWGFVCLRLGQYFGDATDYLCPADCWGDVGAASGPLFAMLACQAHARGYAKGPRTMLWASSEEGLRGAALLEFSPAHRGVIGRD